MWVCGFVCVRVFLEEHISSWRNIYIYIYVYPWRNFSFDEFIRWQQATELCRSAGLTSTVDILTERFNNIIREVLDQLVPVKEVTLRDCRRQPWIYDETYEARKQARRLYERLKAIKDPASKFELRTTLKSNRRLAQSKKAP